MSIKAGSIAMVAGRNVVDRLQSAGLDGNVPIETIREIGNDLVVDKVPGEPDFTFRLESWDTTTDLMAFLHGRIGNAAVGQPPGYDDADGTEYKWEDCEFVNITSPWKRNVGTVGGNVGGGLIIPAFYPTRYRCRFGVSDNAVQEVELAGGSFYYAETPPVEEVWAGDGVETDFVTSESARAHRIGGAGGTTFTRVFGVLVDGVLQVEGIDYTQTVPGATPAGDPALTTLVFANPPANAAQIRAVYFTETAKAIPQAMNADTTIKPGAVRGRNIVVRLDPDGLDIRLPGVQTFEMEATIDGEVEREMGNDQPTGRSINGTDANGTVTTRPKDIPAFFDTLNRVTGVARDEVYGFFNQNTLPIQVDIQNPKNPGEILKSIYFADAQFQPPPLPARVNTATDFAFQLSSVDGTFSEFKKGRP